LKSLLTYLALVGFTTVSVVSVVRAVRTELKRGPEFDSAALGAWLVAPTRDDEKPTTLRRAARQLEQEFFDRFDRQTEYEALDDAGRRTYEANWQRLLLVLARQQADAFAATPKHLREAFVNQRLAQFGTWYLFADGKKVHITEFLGRLGTDRDIAKIPLSSAEQKLVQELAREMQRVAFNRFWSRILPGGTAPRPERTDQ
jgi:hypothetical protein